VPSPHPVDHRRSDEADLLTAIHAREPLAFAEAYSRTVPAAHACALRTLGRGPEVEALLGAVYTELWSDPPAGEAMEGWVRRRCFELAGAELRARDRSPAAASLSGVLSDLPPPETPPDGAERALAGLDEQARAALVRAHDAGVPSAQQPDDDAAEALERALLTLGGYDGGGDGCDLARLGDLALGLVGPDEDRRLREELARAPACQERLQVMQRGRRRLERLEPPADMGLRILAAVLSDGAPAAASADSEVATASLADEHSGDVAADSRGLHRRHAVAGWLLRLLAYTFLLALGAFVGVYLGTWWVVR
jgi:hypothetical protein